MPPEPNGQRTIHDWLQHLDTKLDRIHDKLDGKADSDQLGDLEVRVRGTESTLTRHKTVFGIVTFVASTLAGLFGFDKI